MKSNHKTPELIKVCTDMLNINLQVSDKDKVAIKQNLQDMSNEYGITPFYKYGYKQVIPLLKEEQRKTILFCTEHKYPNRGFVHLQLNPSELDKKLAKSLKGDLDYLLGPNYEGFFCNSTVTRLDIAADFVNLNVDDIVCSSLRQRRSGMFFDQYGHTETIYLGHRKSIFQIKIYNKTAKNKSKGINTDIEQITRIEATINPQCSFKHIARIKNPFEGLKIYKLSDLIADDRLPISFCDSLHHRGLTATLKLLEPDERVAVKKLLNDHVYCDFPADEIFQQWKVSLKKLVPLKVSKDKQTH